jgi:hypothetical protein
LLSDVTCMGTKSNVMDTKLNSSSTVETISHGKETLAILIRASMAPSQTQFVTPSDLTMQVGFVVYPQGGEIPRHCHVPVERRLTQTSEVLVVKKGATEVDIYNEQKEKVATRSLVTGDTIIFVAGGHGFRMTEDTIFLEVKQGPYIGTDEKEHF